MWQGRLANPDRALVSSQLLVRQRVKSGRQDLNLRPHGPEPCALARLSYAPRWDGPFDLSELAGSVNCISSRIEDCGLTWDPGLESGRLVLESRLDDGAFRSSGVCTPSMKWFQPRARPSRSRPKARWKVLKSDLHGHAGGTAPPVGLSIRIAKQVDERQELPRVFGAQVIDQSPGLSIEFLLVATAEAGVAD